MRKAILVLLALAMSAGAQERVWLQKVFDVKYADAQALAGLVRSAMQDRETRVIENVALRAISLGTKTPSDLQTAEELIKRYDVPRSAVPGGGRNIELIAYMLMAAPKGAAGDALPADLEPVAKQLKAVFGYNDFRLLESTMTRFREGVPAEVSGSASAPNPNLPNMDAHYYLRLKSAQVTPSERGNSIRLSGFRFTLRVPVNLAQANQVGGGASTAAPMIQYNDFGFDTELDLRDGQKVVVGKAKVENASGAFILVLTARALD
jgi:hypothetical protein